jgi:hypothetical protein
MMKIRKKKFQKREVIFLYKFLVFLCVFCSSSFKCTVG